MRVLLTGASSFTGSWFATELAKAGHDVVATFRGHLEDYSGIRLHRIEKMKRLIEPVWGIEFGDDTFVGLTKSRSFDALLHHASEMNDYRSWSFDSIAALAKNTRSGRLVLSNMAERGCVKIVLTGTVFEPYEGVGSPGNRAFNPYGLSKHLTFEWFRLEAERLGLSVGKFVIPNPFGPCEDLRFTSHVARDWLSGRRSAVRTPAYIRDNIHVSLLANRYRQFFEALPGGGGFVRLAPSGYVESQGAFAQRFSREIAKRTGWKCELEELTQTDFAEPLFRTNNDLGSREESDWSESVAWDELADYYQKHLRHDMS